MDDKTKKTAGPLFECPSCHQRVPAASTMSVFGRQLCLSCAGAWFSDEDEGDD